jgi:putative MATE family efflux protein
VSEPISSPIRAPGDNAEEVRTLWRLGWPVALGGVGMLGMGAVDTAMVGPLGEQALAALSASNMWVHGLAVFGRGIMMGVDPIVSQAHGRGDSQRIAGAARAVLLLAVLIAIPLWGGYQLAASGLQALGQPAEILPDVALYCRAVALGVPGFMVFWAVRQLMQGVEVMRPATIAIIVANVLNVFLNACFVHGWLGAPALGVVGAGYATAGSSWCMAFMLVWLCRADLLRLLKQPSQHGIVHHARDIVLMGSPVAVQLGIEIWGFVAAGVMIGWMGTTALAGHAIALLVASISFMVPLGIGSGATTRVGNLLGAGFPWQRSGWLAIALASRTHCPSVHSGRCCCGGCGHTATDCRHLSGRRWAPGHSSRRAARDWGCPHADGLQCAGTLVRRYAYCSGVGLLVGLGRCRRMVGPSSWPVDGRGAGSTSASPAGSAATSIERLNSLAHNMCALYARGHDLARHIAGPADSGNFPHTSSNCRGTRAARCCD